jgi:cytochrome c-type biogenesis protein CcmH
MEFWIAAGGIALAVTGLLLGALSRRRTEDVAPAASDLNVYRDQLREVDRDLDRGVIDRTDAERVRTLLSRKILDADNAMADQTAASVAPRQTTLALAGLIGLVMLGAIWGYLRLGAPGYPDLPIRVRIEAADELYRTRPGQAEAERAASATIPPQNPAVEQSFLDLMAKLRTALKDRPGDLQGHQLLAQNEAGLGNFVAAIAAQQQVIAIKGAAATGEDYAALGEMMILAAGGYVSPEAETELVKALQLDPLNGTAAYYAGLMFVQTGRPDRAFGLWAPLLDRSSPSDPWFEPLGAQIGAIAAEAGVEYTPLATATAPGPSGEDVAAAAEMSPEDRQAMIRSMVAQLNDRLATEGGTAEEWARLIGAYGVLGETDRAREIWTEAQARFADKPDDLAEVRAAAIRAGVAE